MGTMSNATGPAAKTPLVALAGNPNSGKTTIFNALTGLRQKVGNYPGVTVERKTGRVTLPDDREAEVLDRAGTYSRIARSPDEAIAMEVLRGLRRDTPEPDVIVVVVDASNLQRNLYLLSQILELGRPTVVALNMMDIARRHGLTLDVPRLSAELGIEVVEVVGHRRRGIERLKEAIARARVPRLPDWPLPEPMKEELLMVGGGLAILDSRDHDSTSVAVHSSGPVRSWICRDDDPRRLDRYIAVAERLLIGDRAADLNRLAASPPVSRLLADADRRLRSRGIDPMEADVEAHYRWIESVASRIVKREDRPPATRWTERIDRILLHRVWGLLGFALIMTTLFVSLFWLAEPLMGGIEAGVGAVSEWATGGLDDGPLKSLLADGIFAGVGAVLVFIPQIALLFVFLAILEDSGYLARAAFIMDRLLWRVGLHGKSFIPLLSSFACAIPGILATRTIENRTDRLATILVAPFMSCSARLPVYTLLIGMFFAAYGPLAQAGVMLLLYVLGIAAAAAVAVAFRRTFLRGSPSAFILELPTYKAPQLSQVARQAWTGTSQFVRRAGSIIFLLSVVVWAATYYPGPPDEATERLADDQNALAAERIAQSFAGRLGHAIEPVIAPLGYDWKIGVGLVGAFAAREVFVSTMGIVYSVGEADEESADLREAMAADRRPDGSALWTAPVAASLLVWFVLAMQCVSTLAVVRRETGGWKWPLLMMVYMNALAYAAALVTYQTARLIVA